MATSTKASLAFQASASNSAGSTTTGTGIDVSAAIDAGIIGQVTNGATGPTVGCDFVVEVTQDSGTTWIEFRRFTADITNSAVSNFFVQLPDWVLMARTKFTGNTGQAVTVFATGGKVSSFG